jgi:hypothetical protein
MRHVAAASLHILAAMARHSQTTNSVLRVFHALYDQTGVGLLKRATLSYVTPLINLGRGGQLDEDAAAYLAPPTRSADILAQEFLDKYAEVKVRLTPCLHLCAAPPRRRPTRRRPAHARTCQPRP